MQNGKKVARAAGAAAGVCALAAAMTGCMASGSAGVVAEVPEVEVAAAPVEVETYPRYYYEGSDVYLVDGRWYARSHDRWVVYRHEPRALAGYRVEYERRHPRLHQTVTAPPVRRHHHH